MSGTIIGVAHDPGGARAVLPVLDFLDARNIPVLALVAGPAVGVAESMPSSLPRLSVDDSATRESCVRTLRQAGCCALLSAAGLYNRIEHTARLAARESGIPLVAVLDWWSAYGERFERSNPDRSIERSWPDEICAMDTASRDGLIEAGFPSEMITITGSVSLESSAQRFEQYARERQQIRSDLGIGDTARCAVFFSEPYIRGSDGRPWGGVGGYFKDDGTPVFGYTSREILLEVSAALAQQFRTNKSIVLFVKPHPMEHIPSLEATICECAKTGLTIRMVRNDDPARLLVAGDIFFGMASIILLEAGMTGKPVLSVQIGLSPDRASDPCVANRLSLSKPIGSRASLKKAIAHWCGERVQAPAVGTDRWHGATARVAECIMRRSARIDRHTSRSSKPNH